MTDVQILAVPRNRPHRWNDELAPPCWEVRCNRCGEWLPCDTEFWYVDAPKRRIHYPKSKCRACCAEIEHAYRERCRDAREAA